MMHRLWEALPETVRRPTRRLLRRVRAHKPARSPEPPKEFFTMCPETPPAIGQALRRIRDVGPSGDYYEFGLFRGYTFWQAQKTASELGLSDMRFFGFDSFTGLPDVTGPDAVTDEFHKGDYACGVAQVRRLLDQHGIDWSRSTLIPGLYHESLRPELRLRYQMRPLALALIDCDLYNSTVPVLKFLDDFLQDGSILLFDDWNCFQASNDHGERRAFKEYLDARPYWCPDPYISFGWHGQGFIMNHVDETDTVREHENAP